MYIPILKFTFLSTEYKKKYYYLQITHPVLAENSEYRMTELINLQWVGIILKRSKNMIPKKVS